MKFFNIGLQRMAVDKGQKVLHSNYFSLGYYIGAVSKFYYGSTKDFSVVYSSGNSGIILRRVQCAY